MRPNLIAPILVFALAGCHASTPPTEVPPVPKFEPGQVWTYKTRPGEEGSRVTVLKVESYPKLGTVVHVRLDGVSIKSNKAPDGVSREIAHLPYSGEALDGSVSSLASSGGPSPAFEDGYNTWKDAFDQGKAGVWTLPLSECVAALEHALSQ